MTISEAGKGPLSESEEGPFAAGNSSPRSSISTGVPTIQSEWRERATADPELG